MASIIILIILLVLKSGSCFYIQPGVIDFTITPKSQVLLENSTLILECSIDIHSLDNSIPLPYIKWQYNDLDLDICSNSTLVHHEGSEIVSVCEIESTSVLDTGWYRCAAVDGLTNCTTQCYTSTTVSSAAYIHILEEFKDSPELMQTTNCSTVHLLPFKLPYMNGGTVSVDFNITWEKDGKLVSNISEVEILSSGTLLISSYSTHTEGIYTCMSGNGIVLMKYKVQYNATDSSLDGNLRLTLIHSYFDSILVEFSYIPEIDYHLELICAVNDICSTTPVSWLYNGVKLNLSERNWLSYDTAMATGEYCCSKNGMKSCVTITDKAIAIGNNSTYLKIPTGNEIDDVSLNCSTDNDIHWYYNGNVLTSSPTYSLTVSSSNFTSVLGIYQCILDNSSVSAIYTLRILPYGLTNPPSSVSLVLIRPISSDHPYGSHIVLCNPPTYTGGLSNTQLQYSVVITTVNVDTEGIFPPTCTMQFHSQCNITCQLNVFDDDDDGYRVFQVQVVDSGGSPISQLSPGETISTNACEVYNPAVPLVSLTCTTNITSLSWQKDSDNAFIPMAEHTVTDFKCLSGDSLVEEHPSMTNSPFIASSSINITEILEIGDVCSYTVYGLRLPSCTGSKSIGSCTVSTIINTQLQYSAATTALIESSTVLFDLLSSSYPVYIDEVSSTVGHTSPYTVTSSLSSTTTTTGRFSPYTVTTSLSSTMTSSSSYIQPLTLSSTYITIFVSSSSSLLHDSSTTAPTMTGSNVNTLIISVSVGLGIVLVCLIATMIVCIGLIIGSNSLKKSRADLMEELPSFDPINERERDTANLHIEVDVISYITNIEGLIDNYDSDQSIATRNSIGELVLVPKEVDKGTNSRQLITEEALEHINSQTDTSMVNGSESSNTMAVEQHLTPTPQTTSTIYDSGSDLSHNTSSSAYSTLSDTSSGLFSLPSTSSSSDDHEDYIGLPTAVGYSHTGSSCYPRHLRATHNNKPLVDTEANIMMQNFPTILEQAEEDEVAGGSGGSEVNWFRYDPITELVYDDDYESSISISDDEHSMDSRKYENMTTESLDDNVFVSEMQTTINFEQNV